jgi:hypothetical protein
MYGLNFTSQTRAYTLTNDCSKLVKTQNLPIQKHGLDPWGTEYMNDVGGQGGYALHSVREV